MDAQTAAAGVADGSITSAKIKDGDIVNVDVATNAAIAYSKLNLTNSIIAADLTTDAVTSAKILDGTIAVGDLSNDAVETNKIKDATVTYAKIQNVSTTDKVLGRISTGAGVVEEIATTGLGNVVRATSPTLVTPDLGTPSAVVLTNATVLPLTTGVTGILPVANGGTGSATHNFVDLSTTQTVAGDKTFSSDIIVNGNRFGKGIGNGGENLAIGTNLGSGTGVRNTGVGVGALNYYTGTSFDNNTGVGYANMQGLTTGYGNTSIGAETLASVADKSYNTAIGNQTLRNSIADSNTALGASAGNTITSGAGNTFLGRGADSGSGTISNSTAIGNGAIANASNTIQLGNSSITLVNTSGAITSALGVTGTRLTSTVATGTAPLVVTSTTPVDNLNITGNAGTATKLAATKTINGVAFDGSADITVTAAGGTLTGIVLGANGGTGVDNSGKNITLGGNLTTAGAFATTITTTAPTAVTLPITGTLATLAGTETLTNKTLVTPVLGVATATSINKVAITTPANGSTLTIADGKTLTANNSIALSGTDGTTITFPTANATLARTDSAQTFTDVQTFSSTIAGSITGNAATVTTNATLTGDVTSSGSNATTVVKINGTSLAGLATGILKNATTTGVPSIAVAADFPTLNQNTTGSAATVTTNANLTGPITSVGNATSVASQTGTGTKFVMDTSPTLVTPALGTPSAAVLTNATGLPVSTGVSGLGTGVATALATPSSANFLATVTDETGTGALVFATSPTLVTPALGTPSVAVLTNATGLPVSTGISGLGTGVATALATPSSANLLATVTDETGTGALVFATSPTFVMPTLGAATATSINGTSIPSSKTLVVSTDKVSVLSATTSSELAGVISDEIGTGALVFATSPTLVTPNLGTPSAAVLTSATGLPLTTGVTGALPIANGGTGATTKAAAFDALSPMTTAGDIIYGGVTNGTGTRLAKGIDGQVLTLASGVPSWSNNGGFGVMSKAASYTITATDMAKYLIFTGSTASQTITLPSAVTAGAGREITIKNVASVSLNINATAGFLISDSTTTTATSVAVGIEPSNNWIKAISDGTNWYIMRALF